MSYKRGKAGENEWCRFLAEAGIDAERNLNERRSGNEGDISSDLPMEFQVKAKKQPSVWKAIREAEEAVDRIGGGRHAVAVLKRKNGRGKPADRIVAMPWEDFREIVGLLKAHGIW